MTNYNFAKHIRNPYKFITDDMITGIPKIARDTIDTSFPETRAVYLAVLFLLETPQEKLAIKKKEIKNDFSLSLISSDVGIHFLMELNMIAKTKVNGVYWINPEYFTVNRHINNEEQEWYDDCASKFHVLEIKGNTKGPLSENEIVDIIGKEESKLINLNALSNITKVETLTTIHYIRETLAEDIDTDDEE